jgi:hypothetical protein
MVRIRTREARGGGVGVKVGVSVGDSVGAAFAVCEGVAVHVEVEGGTTAAGVARAEVWQARIIETDKIIARRMFR